MASAGAGMAPLPPHGAELLLAHASDALIWYEPDGTVLWASPALERVFGWRPDDVIGTKFRMAPADERERSRTEVVEAAARGDGEVTVRTRVRRADGSIGWADTAATFLRDEDGVLTGSVASVRDVTAEVEAEERYRLLAENATDLVLMRDATGTITWASPSACVLLGLEAAELVGTKTLDYVHPDDLPVAGAARQQVASGEVARDVVARLRVGDGSYRYMSMVSHPVVDATGAVTGAVAGIKDVDDLVRTRLQVEYERSLLQASSDSMLDPQILFEAVRDPSGQIVDFTFVTLNRAACEYLGQSADTLRGARLLTVLPELTENGLLSRHLALADLDAPYVLTGLPYRDEQRNLDRYYDIRSVPVGGDLFSLTWSDVTERFTAVRALAASEEKYHQLAENASDVVVHVRDARIAWVSPSVATVFGAPPAAWVGHLMNEFVHPDDVERVAADVGRLTADTAVMSRQRVRGADGTYHWVESNSRLYVDSNEQVDGFLTSLRVVDDLVSSEQELARRARVDDLTGLLNRAEVLRLLAGMVDHGRRRDDQVAVLFCDIDWFKDVNDRHGHASGDEVLRTMAERIGTTIRQDDVAARFGGDEILVVLTGVHDMAEAVAVAEKMRMACREDIDLDGTPVQLTVSIGVAVTSLNGPIDDVIADADRAMYRAKQTGRDRVVSITPDGLVS